MASNHNSKAVPPSHALPSNARPVSTAGCTTAPTANVSCRTTSRIEELLKLATNASRRKSTLTNASRLPASPAEISHMIGDGRWPRKISNASYLPLAELAGRLDDPKADTIASPRNSSASSSAGPIDTPLKSPLSIREGYRTPSWAIPLPTAKFRRRISISNEDTNTSPSALTLQNEAHTNHGREQYHGEIEAELERNWHANFCGQAITQAMQMYYQGHLQTKVLELLTNATVWAERYDLKELVGRAQLWKAIVLHDMKDTAELPRILGDILYLVGENGNDADCYQLNKLWPIYGYDVWEYLEGRNQKSEKIRHRDAVLTGELANAMADWTQDVTEHLESRYYGENWPNIDDFERTMDDLFADDERKPRTQSEHRLEAVLTLLRNLKREKESLAVDNIRYRAERKVFQKETNGPLSTAVTGGGEFPRTTYTPSSQISGSENFPVPSPGPATAMMNTKALGTFELPREAHSRLSHRRGRSSVQELRNHNRTPRQSFQQLPKRPYWGSQASVAKEYNRRHSDSSRSSLYGQLSPSLFRLPSPSVTPLRPGPLRVRNPDASLRCDVVSRKRVADGQAATRVNIDYKKLPSTASTFNMSEQVANIRADLNANDLADTADEPRRVSEPISPRSRHFQPSSPKPFQTSHHSSTASIDFAYDHPSAQSAPPGTSKKIDHNYKISPSPTPICGLDPKLLPLTDTPSPTRLKVALPNLQAHQEKRRISLSLSSSGSDSPISSIYERRLRNAFSPVAASAPSQTLKYGKKPGNKKSEDSAKSSAAGNDRLSILKTTTAEASEVPSASVPKHARAVSKTIDSTLDSGLPVPPVSAGSDRPARTADDCASMSISGRSSPAVADNPASHGFNPGDTGASDLEELEEYKTDKAKNNTSASGIDTPRPQASSGKSGLVSNESGGIATRHGAKGVAPLTPPVKSPPLPVVTVPASGEGNTNAGKSTDSTSDIEFIVEAKLNASAPEFKPHNSRITPSQSAHIPPMITSPQTQVVGAVPKLPALKINQETQSQHGRRGSQPFIPSPLRHDSKVQDVENNVAIQKQQSASDKVLPDTVAFSDMSMISSSDEIKRFQSQHPDFTFGYSGGALGGARENDTQASRRQNLSSSVLAEIDNAYKLTYRQSSIIDPKHAAKEGSTPYDRIQGPAWERVRETFRRVQKPRARVPHAQPKRQKTNRQAVDDYNAVNVNWNYHPRANDARSGTDDGAPLIRLGAGSGKDCKRGSDTPRQAEYRHGLSVNAFGPQHEKRRSIYDEIADGYGPVTPTSPLKDRGLANQDKTTPVALTDNAVPDMMSASGHGVSDYSAYDGNNIDTPAPINQSIAEMGGLPFVSAYRGHMQDNPFVLANQAPLSSNDLANATRRPKSDHQMHAFFPKHPDITRAKPTSPKQTLDSSYTARPSNERQQRRDSQVSSKVAQSAGTRGEPGRLPAPSVGHENNNQSSAHQQQFKSEGVTGFNRLLHWEHRHSFADSESRKRRRSIGGIADDVPGRLQRSERALQCLGRWRSEAEDINDRSTDADGRVSTISRNF